MAKQMKQVKKNCSNQKFPHVCIFLAYDNDRKVKRRYDI